jgi:hypothetical protein
MDSIGKMEYTQGKFGYFHIFKIGSHNFVFLPEVERAFQVSITLSDFYKISIKKSDIIILLYLVDEVYSNIDSKYKVYFEQYLNKKEEFLLNTKPEIFYYKSKYPVCILNKQLNPMFCYEDLICIPQMKERLRCIKKIEFTFNFGFHEKTISFITMGSLKFPY